MLVNLKKFMNKNGTEVKSEKKIKKRLRKYILHPEYGSTKFIDTFYKLSQEYNWRWAGEVITKEMIIDHLINYSYRIINAEIEYYFNNNTWKSENWVIPGISSGRISVRPVDFEVSGKRIWLELEFCTTL